MSPGERIGFSITSGCFLKKGKVLEERAGMDLSEFQYELPKELIAQEPAPERDQSRLLVLHRKDGSVEHRRFRDIVEYLRPGDTLVLNDSRVIPARLWAHREGRMERIELLLIEPQAEENVWLVLSQPARKLRPGTRLEILPRRSEAPALRAEVVERREEGYRVVRFETPQPLLEILHAYGEPPLPPYIQRPTGASSLDEERYQTVYARRPGSVAAPTAGLHFTPQLLRQIQEQGVEIVYVTLHVGPGTFLPVRTQRVEEHRMHSEPFEVSEEAAERLRQTRERGGRIIAVGTTTVRVLEWIVRQYHGEIRAGTGRTDLFIYPPFQFQVVDALITNFHLPGSTLLMLVSAFVSPGETWGRERLLRVYEEAVRLRYRFYSYGDAMFLD